ncbi:PQQ-binding-like beta-propeller repeat protein [Pseudozobellia sp. WGM2]|uniref:outer membrane protein assembly factor BamB family protein n=1 Tax=Pseudozobellia sp. WGM2 TaxID=2787625 RepID=UPI001ADF4123|nr:PQQ-binding-like beta-propeller repeat protein [Pseudozobellia sp. WGM2]
MLSNKTFARLLCFLFILQIGQSCQQETTYDEKPDKYKTWSSYLGDPGRSHFSTLSQITPENIKNLKLAWEYEADDWGQMQMNPIIADSLVYGVTAALRIVAIHAGTGKEIWQFGDSVKVWHSTSRGISYWEKANDKRILCTRGSELYALDALTGKPISSFGDNGKIDMRSGLPESEQNKFLISNTPGAIFKDLIVMPLRVSEGSGAALGDVMAFNIITGNLEWSFKTIPDSGEEGSDTWGDSNIRQSDIVGAANNWSGMAVDEELEIVYVPTGSAAPDFYGGVRKGSNLFANSLVALDANTGEKLWHFQFTHHDIWDRDPPAPPNLLTVERNGKKIDAVAQVTKQGFVFVFDRKTGEPLFDIEERPVPMSKLPGETAWPTQPFPVKPKPFARQSEDLSEANLSPYAENIDELREVFKNADKRMYGPPSLDPVLLLPGYDGAAEWGGAGADPNNGILYVNSNEMPWILQMGEAENDISGLPKGQAIYQQNCATCHQPDRSGAVASGFPSLIGIQYRKEKDEVSGIVNNGKGMMTGFPQIKGDDMDALLRFLYDQEIQHSVEEKVVKKDSLTVPYKHLGYTKFLDSNGLPAIKPPWGTLHAIDLNTGEYIWSIPFGNTPELGEKGVGLGAESYGGPVITENGLLFIAASRDGFFRVFNRHSGKLLFEYELLAPAFATPAMYEYNGKQYIVIACGGEKLGTKKGNKIVAFALE